MAPAILDEVPSAANTNGPDEVLVEESHLRHSMGTEEGAFPDEPDKENIFVQNEDAEISVQSAIEDDLFDDEAYSDKDDDSDFVPRGSKNNPTEPKSVVKKFVPKKVETALAATSETDKNSDGAAGTGNSKGANTQKTKVKTQK